MKRGEYLGLQALRVDARLAQHGIEYPLRMSLVAGLLAQACRGNLLENLERNRVVGALACVAGELDFAGPLQRPQPLERLAERGAGHQQAVVAQD